jgi:type I restriction enzyme M protein
MAIKKSELYSSLWAACDALRGGMDASQYKDYVLVLLFIKYISDKYAGQPFAPVVIPAGSSFEDMRKLKGTKDNHQSITHNLKVVGSNPAPATKILSRTCAAFYMRLAKAK